MALSYYTTAINGTGTITVAAALAGRSVRVHGYSLSNASAASTYQFKSHTAAVAHTGAIAVNANQPNAVAPTQIGVCDGVQGDAMDLVVTNTMVGWVSWSYM